MPLFGAAYAAPNIGTTILYTAHYFKSGKQKQTIINLLALSRQNKNLHIQEQWGWHWADKIVTSTPTRLDPVLDHFQNPN